MFQIGDKIVHPMHGAGIVESIVQNKVNGVTRDYDEAASWYSRAARMGDAWSKSRLADLYKNKLNLIEDSIYWFKQ